MKGRFLKRDCNVLILSDQQEQSEYINKEEFIHNSEIGQ